MSYTLSLGGYDPKDVQRGPFVPFPVATGSNSAVTQSMLNNGNDACGLSSEDSGTAVTGKGASGYSATDQIIGKVRSVSSNTTTANSQEVPSYAMVECGVPGTVLEFPYDTSKAPSIGDRVTMASDAAQKGKVKKDNDSQLTTIGSDATNTNHKVNQNRVLDIDTDNNKVLVFFDPFMSEAQ